MCIKKQICGEAMAGASPARTLLRHQQTTGQGPAQPVPYYDIGKLQGRGQPSPYPTTTSANYPVVGYGLGWPLPWSRGLCRYDSGGIWGTFVLSNSRAFSSAGLMTFSMRVACSSARLP